MIDFKQHFELQDRLNRVINPDWLTAGYRWSDAAMVEAVEAFDHLAWKWWKAGTDNMPQFRLELVDIWHFALSHMLVWLPKEYKHTPNTPWPTDPYELGAGFVGDVLENQKRHATSGGLQDMLRLFIESCSRGVIPIGVFFRLCELAELSLPELDRMYRAKGVLNLFRQANGYKDGSYVKQWAGREDNVWLDAIMATTPVATADQLMDQLSRIYHDVLASPNIGAADLAKRSVIGPAAAGNVEFADADHAARFAKIYEVPPFPAIDATPAELAGYGESKSDPAIRDTEIGFVALDRTVICPVTQRACIYGPSCQWTDHCEAHRNECV